RHALDARARAEDPDDETRERLDRDLLRRPDVVHTRSARDRCRCRSHGAAHRVRDVGETSGLSAVTVDREWYTGERLRREPGDDAAVAALIDPGAVRVEVAEDADR